MKKNAQTMHEVATHCTKFCPCENCGCKNATDTTNATNSTNATNASNSTNTTNAANSTNTTNAANSTCQSDSDVSCKNCLHYDSSKVCTLNLYEEIVNNHHL